MSTSTSPSAVATPPLTALLYPSTLILISVNLVPLVGVLAWGWDAFRLLMLYWMESAIIAFWTIARIATLPAGAMGPLYVNGRPTNSRFAMTLFFVVFIGAFMAGHLLFLWVMFAGEWRQRIHGPSDFYAQIIVASGLWGVLLTLFVSRGLSFLFHVLKPDFILAIEKRIPIPGLPRPATEPIDPGGLIGGLLGRIVLMQIAIIFGGYVALLFGSVAPLFVLVVIKTAVDALLHIAVDVRPHPKPAAAAV
ncbi:MAG TPA: DUF6498-containing protein [Xanthobacteraceae bacterium]|nr:DUF6498-containing protein [Xanthobacteraceae bacterium]